MKLFDTFQRTYHGPALHSEDSYSYINRSARNEISKIRPMLETWFLNYPLVEKKDLISRMKDGFESAFFELFLHELLLRLGMKSIIHPELKNNSGRHPDFLVMEDDKESFILEATVFLGLSDEEKRKEKVLGVLYDEINKLDLHDYFVAIETVSVDKGVQPSGKRFRAFIISIVNKLKYQELIKISEVDPLNLPTFNYIDIGLVIEFSLIPVINKKQIIKHRPIGMYPVEVQWTNTKSTLKKIIERKAKRYGRLELPYVIALNTINKFGTDKDDIVQALFGSQNFIYNYRTQETTITRGNDGVWIGPNGIQNRRLSAVLVCEVLPWRIGSSKVTLFHNPWAYKPYHGRLNLLSKESMVEHHLNYIEGISIGEIFIN